MRIGLINIDKYGLVYLGFSKGQLIKLGIPIELSYTFAKRTAELLPDIKYNIMKQNSWDKYSTLEALQPVYEDFMVVIRNYVNDIIAAGQKNTVIDSNL